jgi:hypothetical protein
MKISFLMVLMLVTVVSLFAQFEPFYLVDEEPGFEQFLGSESCAVDGDNVYWTYLKKDGDLEKVMFARKELGNISYTTVDENQYPNEEFSKPAITIQANGYIHIATSINNLETNFRLIRSYYSSDNGITFENSNLNFYNSIAEIDGPIIKSHNNKIDIVAIASDLSNSEYSLAGYQFFNEYETDENGNLPSLAMAYNGMYDDFNGPVHSNDDIWISELAGWPVFHDSVTTTGQIRNSYGTIPYDEVFLGGYAENVAYRPMGGADQIAQNGLNIGLGADIVYIKMNGSGAEVMVGHVSYVGTEEFDVYSWYPKDAEEVNAVIASGGNWFEDSDNIWTNQVAIYDTVWSAGGSISWMIAGTYWVPDAELWIEGEVNGSVTFGCADTIYITNDIYYSNTMKGMPPDEQGNINPTDYFGLVSEKSIILKYKHRDPFDPDYPIVAPNCDGDVFLYGAYAALGWGQIPQDDGIFSFEYQHPHGSTPNFWAPSPYTGNDTLYTYIDLHKYIFPFDPYVPNDVLGFKLHGNNPIAGNNNTCGFPYESPEYINSYPNNDPQNYEYPFGTDYPWYNPVWPEPATDIVNERGTIHLWGSLAQRRRGYLHRSGTDDFNHPPGNHEWDIQSFHYNGDHGSSGYEGRDYHFDTRFLEEVPPNYPNTIIDPQLGEVLKIFRSNDNGATYSQILNYVTEEYITDFSYDVHEQKCGLAYQIYENQDQIYLQYSEDGGNDFGNYVFNSFGNRLRKVIMRDESVILLTSSETEDVILEFTPANFNCSILTSFDSQNSLSDLIACESGSLIYIQEIEGTDPVDFHFDFTNTSSLFGGEFFWQSELNNLNQAFSNLSLNVNEDDDVYLNLLFTEIGTTDEWGKIYSTSGYLEGLTDFFQYEIIEPAFVMNNYPNPFNPTTTISFNLTTEFTENTELVIYNLKGQKVKTFPVILPATSKLGGDGSEVEGSESNEHSVIWNGTDDNNKPVSSGIYFYKLKSGNFEKTMKMLLMK